MYNFFDFYNTSDCRVPKPKRTMLRLDYKENWNGKLFTDHFNELLPYSVEYQPGTLIEIKLNGDNMGVVKIETVRNLPFSRITDVVSFLNIGRNSIYQGKLLSTEHNGGVPLPPDAMISHIVCGYVQRDIHTQTRLIKEWWISKQKNFAA